MAVPQPDCIFDDVCEPIGLAGICAAPVVYSYLACVAAAVPVAGVLRWVSSPWSRALRHLGGDSDDDAGEEVSVEGGDLGYERTEEEVVDGPPALKAADGEVGTRRRRVCRKKMVYTPYKGGVVQGAYLSHVVATVRNSCCAGSHGVADEAVVRAQLLRLMRQHGMREKHIAREIGGMTLAVQFVTDDDRALAREAWWQRWWGRTRRTTVVK